MLNIRLLGLFDQDIRRDKNLYKGAGRKVSTTGFRGAVILKGMKRLALHNWRGFRNKAHNRAAHQA